jgi:two-component system, NarL family, nitrate/nitrite response regulator NarL
MAVFLLFGANQTSGFAPNNLQETANLLGRRNSTSGYLRERGNPSDRMQQIVRSFILCDAAAHPPHPSRSILGNTMDAKTIFLVEPCTLMREGFARILEENGYRIVGQAEELEHTTFPCEAPTLLIATAAALDAAGVLERVRTAWPLTRVVVLEDQGQKPFSSPRKLDGYLSKELPLETLLKLIEVVSIGHQITRSGLTRGARAPVEEADALTSSETKLLSLLAEGQPNLAIAERLALSEPEVKRQVRTVLRKLRVKNRTQAAVWAMTRDRWSGRRPSEASEEKGCVAPLANLRPPSIGIPAETV